MPTEIQVENIVIAQHKTDPAQQAMFSEPWLKRQLQAWDWLQTGSAESTTAHYIGGSICSYSSLTMKGDSFHLCVTRDVWVFQTGRGAGSIIVWTSVLLFIPFISLMRPVSRHWRLGEQEWHLVYLWILLPDTWEFLNTQVAKKERF